MKSILTALFFIALAATANVSSAAYSVCDRHPQIKNQILTRSGKTDCKLVNNHDLNNMSGIDITTDANRALIPEHFEGLKFMIVLNIRAAAGASFADNFFRYLPELRSLGIESGNLDLSRDAFKGLNKLESLQISGVTGTAVPAFLRNLASLEMLNISFAGAPVLPQNFFEELRNAWRITLECTGDCSQALPANIFHGLRNLQVLVLHKGFNPLQAHHLKILPKLHTISESGRGSVVINKISEIFGSHEDRDCNTSISEAAATFAANKEHAKNFCERIGGTFKEISPNLFSEVCKEVISEDGSGQLLGLLSTKNQETFCEVAL